MPDYRQLIGHDDDGKARKLAVDNQGRLKVVTTSAGGAASVTSAEIVSLSAAVTSADNHANIVSARAVSISNELGSLLASASAALEAHASAASAAATSADAHANAVSARAVSISNELGSLLASASLALETHINTVSARAVSISNELGSLLASASAALETHVNAVSATVADLNFNQAETARVDASGDDLTGEVGNPSKPFATVQGAIDAIEAGSFSFPTIDIGMYRDLTGTVTTSLAKLNIRGASRIDSYFCGHLVLTSAASTSIEIYTCRLGALSATFTNTGNVPLTIRMHDAYCPNLSYAGTSLLVVRGSTPAGAGGTTDLVAKISTTTAGSVIASDLIIDEIDCAGKNVRLERCLIDGDVTACSTLTLDDSRQLPSFTNNATSTAYDDHLLEGIGDGGLSGQFQRKASDADFDVEWVSIATGGGGSVTSTELSAASAQAASAINVVSARAVSISAELASLVQIASAAATSADAHANTVSARAVSISNELGSLLASASAALEAHASAASAAATSADAHANTVSARAVSISAELASLVQIASAAATSADAHANTVSARAVSISNELGSLLASASAALETHINAVSAAGGGGGSVTSTELSAVANASTAGSSPVLSNAISNDASVSAVIKADIGSVSAVLAGRATSISNELGSLLASTSANLVSIIGVSVSVLSDRVTSVSAELVSLMNSADNALSARYLRTSNTANQASITVSTGITVSGVSIVLNANQGYTFEFQIPFTCLVPSGIMVKVVGPATNLFAADYQIPGAAGTTGVAPAGNAVTPFFAQVRAIGTAVSTTSITLTGTTLMARAWGFINPSAGGSIKFVIGPNTSGAANSGVVVLRGANVKVFRGG